jgi:hypothetical protein
MELGGVPDAGFESELENRRDCGREFEEESGIAEAFSSSDAK